MIKQLIITKLQFVTVVLVLLFFYACDKSRIYEENKEIAENIWNKDSVLKFDVNITDPSIATNFFINVRHAEGFPYGNIFLFIKTIFPDGKIANDTLECILADEQGKWLGNGMGDIYDNQIPFKRNVRFPIKGNYKFWIQQGMRVDNLPLVMDVGLRIEKTE